MVRRFAAPLDLNDGQRRVEDVLHRAPPAERDDVRMLEQEERVGDFPRQTPFHERVLQFQSLAVVYEAQVRDARVVHFLFATWIARPSAASAASMIASGSVGCGWIVRAMSCTDAPSSIAIAISLMMSLASGPTICTPSNRSLRESMTTLTNPSVSPAARARPIAANGTLPTRTANPCAVACASSRPTVATSGSVKIAEGIARQSADAAWPDATSAATIPSFEALCARNGWPTTSPIAKTWGTFVRISLSTRMNPLSSVATPEAARLSPVVFGLRPTV